MASPIYLPAPTQFLLGFLLEKGKWDRCTGNGVARKRLARTLGGGGVLSRMFPSRIRFLLISNTDPSINADLDPSFFSDPVPPINPKPFIHPNPDT
jgi:hypothetical protein